MFGVELITANKTLVKPTYWQGKDSGSSFTRIWLIRKGSKAWIKKANKKIYLSENYVYIIPAKTNFEYGVDLPVLIEWCHIQVNFFEALDAFPFFNIPLEIKLTAKEVGNLSKVLMSLQKIPGPNEVHANILFQKNKLMLLESIIPTDLDFKIEFIQGIQKLLPAIELMKSSMKKRVGIMELSKSVHLERNYFSVLFKKVLGVTPIAYYHQLRCKAAQTLLQDKSITIEAIAQELGYVDAFHFSKSFKKTTGSSPSEYRKSTILNLP